MKIRNPRLVAAAGRLGGLIGRTLIRSLRVRYHCLGPDVTRDRLALPDRLIYFSWHEYLLLPVGHYGGPDFAVLISGHADGQILGGLISAMGIEMVRGSSTRGGVEAVRTLVRPYNRWRHLALTPDGPRGPRRVVQPGMIYIASRTGMKIVPIGVGYLNPWRLGSWDRLAIPKPFTRARCVFGEPMGVPAGLKLAALEPYRARVQAEMDRLTVAAETWAETGRLDTATLRAATPLKLAS